MAKGNGNWSVQHWVNRRDLLNLNIKELRGEAARAAKYMRETYKNVVRDVGQTRAARELLENKNINYRVIKGTNTVDPSRISIDTRKMNADQLKSVIEAGQRYYRAESKNMTSLHNWAEGQRASLQAKGYTFQEEAKDIDLDWIYSIISEVIGWFGAQGSPPNVAEAIWEVISENREMTLEEIKAEIKRRIDEDLYVIDRNNDVIWRM